MSQKKFLYERKSPDDFAHYKRISWFAITSLFLGILDVVVIFAFLNRISDNSNVQDGIFLASGLIIAELGSVFGGISFSQKGYGKAISMAGMCLCGLEFCFMFFWFGVFILSLGYTST